MKYIAKIRFRFGPTKKLYEVGDTVEVPKYYVPIYLNHGMIEAIGKPETKEPPKDGLNTTIKEERKATQVKPNYTATNDYTKKKHRK